MISLYRVKVKVMASHPVFATVEHVLLLDFVSKSRSNYHLTDDLGKEQLIEQLQNDLFINGYYVTCVTTIEVLGSNFTHTDDYQSMRVL